MSKEIYISSTPHETRLAIVETDELTEIYYERENEYTLAGSIYNGKVTRVLPGMQSSFVDIGLERDAFLYITDFMEEAGDSADFESSEGRGRSDGRRNGREPHRDDTASPAEGDSPALAAAEPRSFDRSAEPRSSDRVGEPRSDRGDRGRRRRGGGGGGNRDAQPRDTQLRDAQPRDTQPAPDPFFGAELPDPVASISAEPFPSTPDVDLGEGAPGADGSRRWRGRRGRRRGRSGNRDLPVINPAGNDLPDADPVDLTPDPSAGYDLDDSFEAQDIDASAPEDASPIPAADLQPRSDATSFSDRGDRSRGGRDIEDRPRRDRGDRGDRGGRDRRGDRPRAPRGFAPSRALYGVEEGAQGSAAAADGPVPEPLILPGESLSKYRKDADPLASGTGASPASAAPAPAPEFVLPGAWDGGNVLPGETLRPRSGAPASSFGARPEGRRDDRSRGNRQPDRYNNSPDSGRRDSRRVELSRDQVSHQAPSSSIAPLRAEAAPVEHDSDGPAVATPTEATALVHEVAPEPTGHDLTPPHSAEALHNAPEPSPTAQLHPAEVAPTAPTPPSPAPEPPASGSSEEPTEASASFRFDPHPIREFRQPSPQPEQAEPIPLDGSSTLSHSITPPAGTPLAPLTFDEPPTPAAQPDLAAEALTTPHINDHLPAHAEAPAVHDLTSITPEGEMLSQAPPPPPQEGIEQPTSPLQHEAAILHAGSASEAIAEPEPLAHATPAVHSVPATAPPAVLPEISPEADDLIVDELSEDSEGETEEEEEDFHTTTLHAASIEEIDYDEEEETLEGAADLGTMLREMSIDEITQPADAAHEAAEDDFAFEEEDTLENSEFGEPFHEAGSGTHASESQESFADDGEEQEPGRAAQPSESASSQDREDSRRRGGRRDNRRGGRDRGGDRGSNGGAERSFRPSSTGSGDRDRSSGGGRPGRRDGHRSAQTTNLPAISDLLKPGQEVLVQIAKEPIAKKGARITSHIALPGRFLVFMPTVHHTGVSRKIESDAERRRLKEILLSEKGEASGGFIVRTAAAGASEDELRSDLRFLLNLWADIKQRSESSKSPALIYHDLNLVERILRDQVTDNFSAIWVDTESEYERVLRFLQRFQPSLIRRVKLYTKETPLFEQFGITEEINKALRSKVWLKSGGSIVINQTEALVAIDINTGKYVGKTARLEDTIVKTNLDAIPEIVRQIRLRDLGGIIIIDFIDMDERKNRHKVMAVLEEELKKDRAPSKVLQFNDFGLVAITRKRVKQSLERTLSTTCGICAGTGMIKSAITVCNDIYIEMRKMQKHLDRGDVMLRVNPEVVKQLKSPTAKWLQEMEEMIGRTILVKSDPTLHPEQFDIH